MTKKDFYQVIKRFLITFACCVPLFVFVGVEWGQYFSQTVMVIMFTVFAGGVFALEELHNANKLEKQKQIKENKNKGAK